MPAIFRHHRVLTKDGVKVNVVEAGQPDGPRTRAFRTAPAGDRPLTSFFHDERDLAVCFRVLMVSAGPSDINKKQFRADASKYERT